MNSSVLNTIRDAINNHRQLLFVYDGLPREVCPHALGTKGPEWHVFVWQFGGQSRHGLKPGGQNWRCIEVDRISSLTVRDGPWYRGWTKGLQPSSCIDVIDTVVDAAHAAVDQRTSPARTP